MEKLYRKLICKYDNRIKHYIVNNSDDNGDYLTSQRYLLSMYKSSLKNTIRIKSKLKNILVFFISFIFIYCIYNLG